MFTRHYFSAQDIFLIGQVEPLPAMPAIANLRISKNYTGPATDGCGLYFIEYQGNLIYIGKFLGTKSDPFGGDIFSARWCRHMSTLPVRGARISIGNSLVQRFQSEESSHPLASILNSSDQTVLAHDRGFMVPFNRLKFAALHWKSFEQQDNSWISDFQFGYLQLSKSHWVGYPIQEIREIVNKVESLAIERFKPICNAEISFSEESIQHYEHESIFTAFEDIFKFVSNQPTATPSVELDIPGEESLTDITTGEESGLWGERFSESLLGDCPQETVNAIYEALESDLAAQVHHTKTNGGDVRVRALDIARQRNIFTMYWQARKEVFFCRIFLKLEEVVGAGILNVTASRHDPLPTEFKFDCSQPGAIANLKGLIHMALATARA